jgi:hypothetical protein
MYTEQQSQKDLHPWTIKNDDGGRSALTRNMVILDIESSRRHSAAWSDSSLVFGGRTLTQTRKLLSSGRNDGTVAKASISRYGDPAEGGEATTFNRFMCKRRCHKPESADDDGSSARDISNPFLSFSSFFSFFSFLLFSCFLFFLFCSSDSQQKRLENQRGPSPSICGTPRRYRQ